MLHFSNHNFEHGLWIEHTSFSYVNITVNKILVVMFACSKTNYNFFFSLCTWNQKVESILGFAITGHSVKCKHIRWMHLDEKSYHYHSTNVILEQFPFEFICIICCVWGIYDKTTDQEHTDEPAPSVGLGAVLYFYVLPL